MEEEEGCLWSQGTSKTDVCSTTANHIDSGPDLPLSHGPVSQIIPSAHRRITKPTLLSLQYLGHEAFSACTIKESDTCLQYTDWHVKKINLQDNCCIFEVHLIFLSSCLSSALVPDLTPADESTGTGLGLTTSVYTKECLKCIVPIEKIK